ncbi:hypothetical protein ANTQUA_LOCUS10504 [Anthophora quadrimaculata]
MATRTKTKEAASQTMTQKELVALQKEVIEHQKRVREKPVQVEQACQEITTIKMLREELQELKTQWSEMQGNGEAEPLRYFTDEPMEYIMKEAIASIPLFDGADNKVLQFCKACKGACEIVPNHMEKSFTRPNKVALETKSGTTAVSPRQLTEYSSMLVPQKLGIPSPIAVSGEIL